MIRPVSRHACSVAALVLALAGCGALATQERRAAQGPSAEEIWTARVVLDTGHEPTFDEKQRWDDQMDQRISQYLARNPALANSLNVTTFRITRQVTVGMERDLVLLLLGPPVLFAKDGRDRETRAPLLAAGEKQQPEGGVALPAGLASLRGRHPGRGHHAVPGALTPVRARTEPRR